MRLSDRPAAGMMKLSTYKGANCMRGLLGSLLLLMAAAGFACGDKVGPNSGLVGGRCIVDGDCQGRCLRGGDFPGGYCSVPCGTDRDCPEATACIDKEGGVCLLQCRDRADCVDLGPDYTCAGKSSKAVSGLKVAVCIKD
jgi:hypothetical protein